MSIIIGLDVHPKSSTKFCIQDKNTGEQLKIGECDTNYEGFKKVLGPWMERFPGVEVGMEAGGKTYHVAAIINELGGIPRIFVAEEVHDKTRSRKKKTDYRDAIDLCTNFRTGSYVREVKLPPKELKELRTLLKTRDLYVRQRIQIINQTRGFMKEYGITDDIMSFQSKKGWQSLLNKDMPEILRKICEFHHTQHENLTESIEKLEQKIAEWEEISPEFEIVKTIPGVGAIACAALKAYIFDITRFESGKHLASYFGLVPSCYDSGEQVRHGRITKEGNGFVRRLLVEAAHHYANPRSPFYPFYARLLTKKGYKKAVVALASKLCRVIYAILKFQVPFDLNLLGVLKGPIDVPRRYYYRLNRDIEIVQK